MNELEALREENERLKEDLAVKVAAIEWVLALKHDILFQDLHRNLRARAYPEPETEEVDEEIHVCLWCAHAYKPKAKTSCCGEKLQVYSRKILITKPRRVKRREEIHWSHVDNLAQKEGAKYYCEWEE